MNIGIYKLSWELNMKLFTFLLFIIISSGSFGSDLKSLKSFCEDMRGENIDLEFVSLYLELHGFENVREWEAGFVTVELLQADSDAILGNGKFASNCVKRLIPKLLKKK